MPHGQAAASGEKVLARAATIGLDDATVGLLRECFKQFHIQTTSIPADAVSRLHEEKFDACILRLNQDATAVLEAARNANPKRRLVVYGICDSAEEALRYARYGINAIFQNRDLPGSDSFSTGDRDAVMKVVKATHLLVVNELRRHIRVPLVTDVLVEMGGLRFTVFSNEISAGGLSVSGAPPVAAGQQVLISFVLLEIPRITVRAKVSWIREPGELGLRFDNTDQRRFPVREWIESYLDMS